MDFVTIVFEDKYGKGSADWAKLKAEIEGLLRRLYETYSGFRAKKKSGSSSASDLSQDRSAETMVSNNSSHGVRDTFFSRYSQKMQTQKSNDDVLANELDIYLMENVDIPTPSPMGFPWDILSWWKANSTKFPVLAEIARDVLAIPVSNVSSESVFSIGDRILDPYRSSLTPFMVEVLILTQNWLKSLSYSYSGVIISQMLAETEYMDSLQEYHKQIEFEEVNNRG